MILRHFQNVVCGCLWALPSLLFAHEIIIQPDYWTANKCIENGMPWQVPGSIYKEDECCQADDVVMEFGTGGSTIFYARRCKHVLALETDPEWTSFLAAHLEKLGVKNVTLMCIQDQSEIVRYVQNNDLSKITIVSVDTVHGYDRSVLLDAFLNKGISDKLRMIVLDNYAAPELFSRHYNIDPVSLQDWEVFKYDDVHWLGNGTKLYIRK